MLVNATRRVLLTFIINRLGVDGRVSGVTRATLVRLKANGVLERRVLRLIILTLSNTRHVVSCLAGLEHINNLNGSQPTDFLKCRRRILLRVTITVFLITVSLYRRLLMTIIRAIERVL